MLATCTVVVVEIYKSSQNSIISLHNKYSALFALFIESYMPDVCTRDFKGTIGAPINM